MRIERIAVIGMGALGILYGSMLADALGADSIGFIADEARIERYRSANVTANDRPYAFRYLPAGGAEQPADMVLFAVKAGGLAQAMEDAAPYIGESTAILSVLNGITSEALLEERFGSKHVVYCVAEGMDAVKSGSALTYSRSGRLCVGIPQGHPEKQPALDAICELLVRAGIAFSLDPDIRHRLWSKFMLNVGVNQVVMVEEGTYGTVQAEGPARERMKAAMREVIHVSAYEGVNVTEDDLAYYVGLMDTLSPEGMPSMRQDGLAHRLSEVELFSGTVLRLAAKHGLETPVNRELYRRVKEMEAAY